MLIFRKEKLQNICTCTQKKILLRYFCTREQKNFSKWDFLLKFCNNFAHFVYSKIAIFSHWGCCNAFHLQFFYKSLQKFFSSLQFFAHWCNYFEKSLPTKFAIFFANGLMWKFTFAMILYLLTYRTCAINNRGFNSKILFLTFRLSYKNGIKIAF